MQNSSPILRWKFLARKGAKFIAPISAFWQGKVQNSSPSSALLLWRHFRLTLSLSLYLSLYLSLSLSLSLSHRAHLTHNIGSASALPIILKNRTRHGMKTWNWRWNPPPPPPQPCENANIRPRPEICNLTWLAAAQKVYQYQGFHSHKLERPKFPVEMSSSKNTNKGTNTFLEAQGVVCVLVQRVRSAGVTQSEVTLWVNTCR